MELDDAARKELLAFPAALRALLDAELAAGNEIVEIGHSHPAPPAGAYCRLAKKVSTHPRASGNGLDFYERNSSLHSSEFTDEKRFFFVLEPPDPPPSEPDMDAIRRSLKPRPDPLVRLSRREPAASSEEVITDESSPQEPWHEDSERGDSLEAVRTPTSSRLLLHFQDRRPPHEVRFFLERRLRTPFTTELENGRLCMRGTTKMVGVPYFLELRFEATMGEKNHYSLRVEASWAELPATHHDYYRKNFESWFGYWTSEFTPARPPAANEGSEARYRMLCEAALRAEAHLDSIPAIQEAIVAALKAGRSFSTSHKEGGTNLTWRGGRFVRSDYGYNPTETTYPSEPEFLEFLRRFYDWETSSSVYPEKVSELDAWRLILRFLRPE